jgi:DNA-binding NtrC family response regulator
LYELKVDAAVKGRILIVDDNISVLKSLELFLKNKFDEVATLRDPNQLLHYLAKTEWDIVLLDMNFSSGINNGNEGLYWLKRILNVDPAIVVILITAYADIELAVKAIREGGTDFIIKPWENQKLYATLEAGMKLRLSRKELLKYKNRHHLLREDMEKQFRMVLGKSDKMKAIDHLIEKVSKTSASILITGENGTGKELVAREIHLKSPRKDELMVTVDLGSISETLFESEMFGHSKGAFTDAKENRTGRIENASGGTLFLDEIGNLPIALQAKLLNALETRKITPVGSNKVIPVDIRLISATNKDLEGMVKTGHFREDLLYRINTVHIELPPLRERREDIMPLAEYFLNDFAFRYEKNNIRFNASAIEILLKYKWPGNIRELKHTIERAVILSENEAIAPEDLALSKSKFSGADTNFSLSFEEAEKRIIITSLEKCKWNISEAAKELNIGRQTLYRKIQKYDLQ